MSAFARSPESYAAWQQLKGNVALRVGVDPHGDNGDDDELRAQRNRGTQELHRLLSRTSNINVHLCSSLSLLVVRAVLRVCFTFAPTATAGTEVSAAFGWEDDDAGPSRPRSGLGLEWGWPASTLALARDWDRVSLT